MTTWPQPSASEAHTWNDGGAEHRCLSSSSRKPCSVTTARPGRARPRGRAAVGLLGPLPDDVEPQVRPLAARAGRRRGPRGRSACGWPGGPAPTSRCESPDGHRGAPACRRRCARSRRAVASASCGAISSRVDSDTASVADAAVDPRHQPAPRASGPGRPSVAGSRCANWSWCTWCMTSTHGCTAWHERRREDRDAVLRVDHHVVAADASSASSQLPPHPRVERELRAAPPDRGCPRATREPLWCRSRAVRKSTSRPPRAAPGRTPTRRARSRPPASARDRAS